MGASTWAFRFLLWYICILCVQPQNRFTFLYPLHIADICIGGAVVFHFVASSQEGRPFIRLGPATVTALLLMMFGYLSLHVGAMQTSSAWNTNIDVLMKNALVLILVEAMAFTPKRVWIVAATVMLSTLWWVKGGIRLSGAGATYSGDRLMGPAVSLIENPNGFAYMMTVMLPLYLYFFQKAPKKWMRMSFLGLAFASVYIVLQTGSRTGLLALIAVGVFLLPKYGAQHKMALVLAAVAVTLFMGSVGKLNIERFKTIPASIKNFVGGVDENADPSQMNQDEQSAWERKMKNKHTWKLILDYPVFGIGVHPNDEGLWEKYPYATGQVHNEILYAGRQMGFIGMGLYLSFLTTLYRLGRRVQKKYAQAWPVLADLGWTFKMQAVVIAVGGFFSPIPWNPITMILCGSASALWGCVEAMAVAGSAASQPAPASQLASGAHPARA